MLEVNGLAIGNNIPKPGDYNSYKINHKPHWLSFMTTSKILLSTWWNFWKKLFFSPLITTIFYNNFKSCHIQHSKLYIHLITAFPTNWIRNFEQNGHINIHFEKEEQQQTVHANIGLPCISNQFCRGRGQTVEHTPHGRPCHTLHIPSPRLVAGTSAHPKEGKGGGDRGITIMHITKPTKWGKDGLSYQIVIMNK